MLYEIFYTRWVTTSINFYFLDKTLCICVFLFSFTAAKKMGQRVLIECCIQGYFVLSTRHSKYN